MIVGLTGPNAAGKGEAARFLVERGFVHHSLSDVVREEATARGLDHSRENLIRVGNDLRAQFGAGVLSGRIAARIEGEILARMEETMEKKIEERDASGKKDLIAGAIITVREVVDSIRSPAEVAVLRRLSGFLLMGIDAPVAVRFERSRARGRTGDGATLEEFTRKEALENSTDPAAQQLSATLFLADVVVENPGTLEELRAKVAAALGLPVGAL